jgi:hypothetical protein
MSLRPLAPEASVSANFTIRALKTNKSEVILESSTKNCASLQNRIGRRRVFIPAFIWYEIFAFFPIDPLSIIWHYQGIDHVGAFSSVHA